MELNAKTLAKTNHFVNIINREKIEVQGASEVMSSTDKEIIAKLQDSFIFVTGTNLSILKLVPEEMLLVASGNISGLKYENRLTKKSFLKKVFK
jgi:hypothetical protein